MDVRKIVVPLLFLAVVGVMLPVVTSGTSWTGVIGWTVAGLALLTALCKVFWHTWRTNHRNHR